MRYTNADVLVHEKFRDLREYIDSSDLPDISAITEPKPEYYTRELSEVDDRLKF